MGSSVGTPPRRIAIVHHPRLRESLAAAQEIASYLNRAGAEAVHDEIHSEDFRKQVQGGEFDLLLAVGGDGTVLRAGRLCAPYGLPILGINLGHFGFLAEAQPDEWPEVLDRVLRGDYWLEARMMLSVEHWRESALLGEWEVLNECVIGRGKYARPVRLKTELDGFHLTTYVADGLICATPTGSTAYALAVGGPILPPELSNFLLLPVAPHLSVDRAIVLSEGTEVKVTVYTDHEATLSADGQAPAEMADGDHTLVCAGKHRALFARTRERDYFYRNLTSRMDTNPSADYRP